MRVLVYSAPWVTGSIGILALAYSFSLWIASAQKCGGVQMKIIITSSKAWPVTSPVIAVHPSSGGVAPASPPMAMFCGVARFKYMV